MSGGRPTSNRAPKHLKPLFLTLLFLILITGIPAQETKAAVGIGPEWNMNARENFAGGAAAAFDYVLPYSFALGVSFTASTNFSGFTALEPAVLLRRYFSSGGGKLFVQADAGVFLIFEDGKKIPMFMGGLRGGYRLPLKSSLYIEPYGRLGYPFAFGIGAAFGIRFLEQENMIFRR